MVRGGGSRKVIFSALCGWLLPVKGSIIFNWIVLMIGLDILSLEYIYMTRVSTFELFIIAYNI